MKIDMKLKSLFAAAVLVPAAVLVGGGYWSNKSHNSYTTQTKDYVLFSQSVGLGHIEYVKYSSGSQDLMKAPSSRFQKPEFFQDLNGDGLVDIIRQNNPWKEYQLELLTRKLDYDSNREQFDRADAEMKKWADLINNSTKKK